MKNDVQTLNYVAPIVEVVEVEVEQGFAASDNVGQDRPTPGFGGGEI